MKKPKPVRAKHKYIHDRNLYALQQDNGDLAIGRVEYAFTPDHPIVPILSDRHSYLKALADDGERIVRVEIRVVEERRKGR